MDLKHLTDECLLNDTEALVQRERELLTTILHHLHEVERRRLFGEYSSLYTYAIGRLGYSGDQAFRRIAAMRVMKQIPEIEAKLDSGEINLTHVGIAQAFFNGEKAAGQPLSTEEKRELFETMASQTTREAQRTVQQRASKPLNVQDSIKALADDRNVLTAEVNDGVLAKLEKLKGLLAHQMPNAKIGQLLDRALEVALEELNPAKPTQRKVKADSEAEVRRQIWARDGGKCTICGSHHAVQEDHRVPGSMGGPYTLENMRLLCRNCNQREAINKLGLDKMARYFDREWSTRGAAGEASQERETT